ncbi:unnamed protein product [Angiostrongylus costaricensis]|uniref:HTH_48 domain-containing protein n=1 Tax=Angiostrongylus costaricensis TaxID=334426 RepID=A0A0R3PQM2_ANGCS|nr:unnamed protein product [Angiostrongylus costaricensis]
MHRKAIEKKQDVVMEKPFKMEQLLQFIEKVIFKEVKYGNACRRMSKTNFRQIFFYEFKLGRCAAETALNVNQIWGVGESTVRAWLQKFRSGDFDLEVKEGHGRPNELDNDELKALVEANTRRSVRELAEWLGLSTERIPIHLNRIGKTKELGKWCRTN